MIENEIYKTVFDTYPDVVGVGELAQMLNIGKNQAYKLVNSKKIHSIRIGRQHKIPKCFVIDYLKSQN